MPRLLPVTTALAAAAASLTVAVPHADAATAKPQPTSYAFKASGTGSKITGGSVPAGSSPTAYSVIGCTNLAGLDHHNTTASAAIPGGYGTMRNLSSHTWTSKVGRRVSSWSRHAVESITIARSGVGSVAITGIRSLAHAYHDKTGFHAATTTSVAAIKYTFAGVTQTYQAPSPGRQVAIPGLATIGMGARFDHSNASHAHAQTSGLNIAISGTKTVLRVAQAKADLSSGVVSGLFHGHADGIHATAAGGAAKIGREPNIVMPCVGTNGALRKRSTASVPLSGSYGDVLDLGAVHSQEKASQTARRASGYTEGSVTHADLGGGQLVLDGIVGRVNASWNKRTHHYTVSSRGTTVGSIRANGQTYTFPQLDGQTIPNVGRVDTDVFTKTRNGGTVTAVRITLLDSTGAPTGSVIDLGNATFRIQGLR